MLDGVLVVTGGASGIGLACAKAMVAAHDQVALIDVNEDGLAAAAAQIDKAGGAASTFVGDVAGVRTGQGLFVLPPTPPPDIDLELWKESIETVRQWHASTLFLTHYGPHEDPEAHLDALLVHMDALKQTSKECLEFGGSDADQQQRFLDEIRTYLARHIPNHETNLYNTAAPLDQCWLGLVRYWRKRGVTAL